MNMNFIEGNVIRMKILSAIFSVLGMMGIIFSGNMYGGIKLITMTASLGALMCGIGFILSYANFTRLDRLDEIKACNNADGEYKSKAV